MFHLYTSPFQIIYPIEVSSRDSNSALKVNSASVSNVNLCTSNSTFNSMFHPGCNSSTDTNDNPRINPGYNPSSSIDIASPVHVISASSDSKSRIQRRFQFRLLFLTIDPMTSSSSSIDSSDIA